MSSLIAQGLWNWCQMIQKHCFGDVKHMKVSILSCTYIMRICFLANTLNVLIFNTALNQVDSAYKDAREVHRVDPKNAAIEPVLVRLHKAVSLKLNDLSQTSTKVKNMFEIVFDPAKDKEKREKAADNLVVLGRERNGADLLFKEGAILQIARLMKVEKNVTIRLSLIRCIGELAKKSIEIAQGVLKDCGIPFFMDILNSNNVEVVNASSYIIQVCKKIF